MKPLDENLSSDIENFLTTTMVDKISLKKIQPIESISLINNSKTTETPKELGQHGMHQSIQNGQLGQYSTMSNSSLKVSANNRPVRHLGPPPGFSSIRPKQVNEHGSTLGQNPLNDDHSWLDGYQLQSSMKSGINLQSNQYVNDSVATSSFPFPGKQEKQKNLENLNLNINLNSNSNSKNESIQQQYISRIEQQGQLVWKGNQFV